jgi:hypothetical protein
MSLGSNEARQRIELAELEGREKGMNKLDSIHRHLFAISGALGMLMWVPSALADTTITYQGQLK